MVADLPPISGLDAAQCERRKPRDPRGFRTCADDARGARAYACRWALFDASLNVPKTTSHSGELTP